LGVGFGAAAALPAKAASPSATIAGASTESCLCRCLLVSSPPFKPYVSIITQFPQIRERDNPD
jgi:hypothetical protein